MTETFTTIGVVATDPRHLVTQEGLPITSFRLAATARRFNRTSSQWENAETNWFTVTAFRQLAMNAAASISKGQRVIVNGRLKIRDWDNGERSGTIAEVDANSIGHDLTLGSCAFTRNVRAEADGNHSDRPFDPDEMVAAISEEGDGSVRAGFAVDENDDGGVDVTAEEA